MIWPWRVVLTYAIAFYTYQSTFLSKKLNVEEKLTGRPSPSVYWFPNFGKRYEDDLRIIFDQWPKLHLGLDALSNQKILKGVYYLLHEQKRTLHILPTMS